MDGFEQSLSKNGLKSSPVCLFEEPAHLRIWFNRLLNSFEAGSCGRWVSRNLFKATNSGVPEALSYISLSELRLDLESLLGCRRLNFHHHWVHLVTIKIHSSILSVSSKSANVLLLGQARNVCLGQYFWHQESTHSSWASARTCFPSLVWFPVTEKLFPLSQPPLQDPPAGPSMSFQPGLLISSSKIE